MPRFILLVKSTPTTEGAAATAPPADFYERVGKYNNELVSAGIFVDAGGFKPTADSYKVAFGGDAPTVTKGPFDVEAENHVSGFWIIKVGDLEEALGWAKKMPFGKGEVAVKEMREQ